MRMLGSLGRHGQCSCCNGPAWDKRAEDRAWRREWDREQDEIERQAYDDHMWESTHRPGDTDCRHGCNGDCVTGGNDACTFTCHT